MSSKIKFKDYVDDEEGDDYEDDEEDGGDDEENYEDEEDGGDDEEGDDEDDDYEKKLNKGFLTVFNDNLFKKSVGLSKDYEPTLLKVKDFKDFKKLKFSNDANKKMFILKEVFEDELGNCKKGDIYFSFKKEDPQNDIRIVQIK